MRRAYSNNPLSNIDEYITRDDREPIEDVYKVEGYEDWGTFHTYEEALDYFYKNHEQEYDYPQDLIYKIRECE